MIEMKYNPRVTSTPIQDGMGLFGNPTSSYTNKSGNSSHRAKEIPPHISQGEIELKMEEDIATRKLMLQRIPRSNDWPKFYGKSEENFMDLIDFINGIADDCNPPNQIITCRISSLFKGIASHWYLHKRREHGQKPWKWWRQAIISQFFTSVWLSKMQMEFENDDRSDYESNANEMEQNFCDSTS